MEGFEKVICCDHNNNDNALAAAIIANGNRRNDTDPMAMAMMGGGFGMNQWMNNPFAYMMMMAWMRNFGGGWGEGYGMAGQNAQNIELQNQIQSLRTQLQDNQNANLLMKAIGDGFQGNDFALSQLSQNLGVDFKALQQCCCDVRAAIREVSGQVGFTGERVINAANLGDCRIIEALKDCCCQNKELIQRMGYENQLGQKDMMFAAEQGFCRVERGQDFINRSIERGFSAMGFQQAQDKCDIIRAGQDNTQRIIDTLTGHWSSEQQLKIQDLKNQLAQRDQTDAIFARLNGGCGCNCHKNNGCGCNRF